MTLECCNRMAKTLWESHSMLEEAVSEYAETYPYYFSIDESVRTKSPYQWFTFPKSTGYSPVRMPIQIFDADQYTGHTYVAFTQPAADYGFWSQYGIPKSQTTDLAEEYPELLPTPQKVFPGLYPTRMDMNCLFGIGQEHGKMKLRGWKMPISGESYGRAVSDTRIVPMSTLGIILRDFIGYKAIKCTYATEEQEKKGTRDTRIVSPDGTRYGDWKRYDAKMGFQSSSSNEANGNPMFTLSTPIPRVPQNYSGMIWSGTGDGKIHLFHDDVAILDAVSSNIIIRPLMYGLEGTGNIVLKLSKYADLLTNEEHQNDYITIVNTTNYVSFGSVFNKEKDTIGLSYITTISSPAIPVPLKYGVKYYIYAECKNGGIAQVPSDMQIGGMRLVDSMASRQLLFPSWED